ncbi:GNAT family N-acetyltransferase [Flavobacteriaceae bacterium M23B6Z8]
MENWLQETSLTGNLVKLIPLRSEHKESLIKAASDGKLWQLWYTSVPSEKNIDTYMTDALEQKNKGTGLPFAVVNLLTDEIIGSTRFCNAEPKHRRLEIGYTWYAKSYQRTGSNTDAKYLLLQHAFEVLKCIAVEFRTNWFNQTSRKAIERLGAHQDGILRNHRLNEDGSTRDSVVFSITQQEWPSVKKSLKLKLNR